MARIFKFKDWSPIDTLLWLEFMSYQYGQSDNMHMNYAAKIYWSKQHYINKLETQTNPFSDNKIQWNMYYNYKVSLYKDKYIVQYKYKLLGLPIWRRIENKSFTDDIDAKLCILKHITKTIHPDEIRANNRDAKLKKLLR